MQRRERDLGGGDEPEVALVGAGAEEVVRELRQLAGAGHRRPGDEVRDGELGVAVPAGVQGEEERRQRPLEHRPRAARDAEPGTRELGRATEVEDAHRLAELDVVARGVERRGVADAADLDGVGLGGPVGGVVGGQVGDREQQVAQRGLRGLDLLLGLADALLELAGALLEPVDVGRRRPALRGLPDLAGGPLRLGAQLVDRADGPRPSRRQRLEAGQVERVAAPTQTADRLVTELEQEPCVVHPGASSPGMGGNRRVPGSRTRASARRSGPPGAPGAQDGAPRGRWSGPRRTTRGGRRACRRARGVEPEGVGEGGVEPPHPFGYTDLNRARLPFRHSPGVI